MGPGTPGPTVRMGPTPGQGMYQSPMPGAAYPALLKRLESVKPTVGMTRSEQLMDYQRQAGFLSSTATSPRPGKASVSRLSHASSSGGVSRVSSANSRSSRMGSSAALLRPTKSSNVRAAWM